MLRGSYALCRSVSALSRQVQVVAPHARAFHSYAKPIPTRKWWLLGAGTVVVAYSISTAYSDEKEDKKDKKDKKKDEKEVKKEGKKHVKAEHVQKGAPKVEPTSAGASSPVVPSSPQKAKIVHVLTEDEKKEMQDRLDAEKKAKLVLQEHSMHEGEEHNHASLTTSHKEYPIEMAELVFPPNVPPPVNRSHPVRLVVNMNTFVKEMPIDPGHTYDCWTFNGSVPGPFIRARKGDILEVHFRNEDTSGMFHNLDFHAVSGPGGGAPLLTAEQGQTKRACFKLLYPGLYIYHCAVDPIAVHVTNGMYGAIFVEPEEGLPHVDKEFAVIQSEYYAAPNDDPDADKKKLVLSYNDVQMANPSHVVFNGRDGALTENPLVAPTDSRVRIYFANAGPNLISSFHVIGTIFDKLYREGDVVTPPARGIQSTCVAAGGSAVVEMKMSVPGTYTLVDHSLHRVEKGAVGYLNIIGAPRPDIYHSEEEPQNCPDCRLHP